MGLLLTGKSVGGTMDETERALHNLRIVLAKLRARDERKYVEVREEIIREHGHLRKSKMNA